MISPSSGSVVAGSLGSAVVAAYSTPTLLGYIQRLRPGKDVGYRHLDDIYSDEDGKASEESQKCFSTIVQRSIALLAGFAGLSVAIVDAVLMTIKYAEGSTVEIWLRVVSWVRGHPPCHPAPSNSYRCSLRFKQPICS